MMLNTGFFYKGALILDKNKILKHYLSESFIIDLVTIGPVLISLHSQVKYIELTFLLRIFKLHSMIKKIEEIIHITEYFSAIF